MQTNRLFRALYVIAVHSFKDEKIDMDYENNSCVFSCLGNVGTVELYSSYTWWLLWCSANNAWAGMWSLSVRSFWGKSTKNFVTISSLLLQGQMDFFRSPSFSYGIRVSMLHTTSMDLLFFWGQLIMGMCALWKLLLHSNYFLHFIM